MRRSDAAAGNGGGALAATSLVLEHGGSEDEAIGAFLHDAIEDQGGAATGEMIRQRFGDSVLAIMCGCTDTELTPSHRGGSERKTTSHTFQTHRPRSGSSQRPTSCTTRGRFSAIHRELEGQLWSRFTGGKAGTLWYYRALVTAFRVTAMTDGLRRLVDELDRVVTELERLADAP
jgi:hypothetical protein